MISEAFHCPPDVAERQDMNLCLEILAMRAYDDVMGREEHGGKLTESDYLLILTLETAAGVREA